MSNGFNDAQVVRRDNPVYAGQLDLIWVSHTDRSSTGIVNIGPGGGLKPHFHESHDEIITILDGEVEFRFGDQTRVVTPGEVIAVPSGMVHSPTHSENGCLMVSVFAPRFDSDNPDRVFVDD